MRAMLSMVCAATAAATAGACTSPELDLGVEVAYLIPPGQEDPCPPDGCGNGNSPVVKGVYFWRLHTRTVPGLPNPEGVRITDVRLGTVPLRLEVVDGDRLRGVHPTTGAPIVDYTAVVGTQIAVEVDGAPYEIRVVSAAPTARFWAGDPVPMIWEYELRYRPLSAGPDQRERALCSEGDGDPTKVTAIVFGGDLYNPVTLKIATGRETHGWLNIACKDSAVYKMYRIGYASAAEPKTGFSTTLAQRHAMLNAWTSNLCGDGTAHTRQGEPIKMRESLAMQNPLSPYLGGMASFEAIFKERGAVCLGRHRLDDEQADDQADEEEPDDMSEITDQLRTACGEPLPTCTDLMIDNWAQFGDVLIGNQ